MPRTACWCWAPVPLARWWSASCTADWTGADWQITWSARTTPRVPAGGVLVMPFGTGRPDDVVKPRLRFISDGVNLVLGQIDRVAPETGTVEMADGGSSVMTT